MENRDSWHCGRTKVIPYVVLGRVVDYRYAIFDGCGAFNAPSNIRCWDCGRERPGNEAPQNANRAA